QSKDTAFAVPICNKKVNTTNNFNLDILNLLIKQEDKFYPFLMSVQVHTLQPRPVEYDWTHEASKPPPKADYPAPYNVLVFLCLFL
ncbi:hypothetical protein, partial [Escherichia coli]|uniref:hypothetical protein n=1 Tax=Escherichia coli TaxID=562 RepID=UPI0030C6D014